MNDQEYRALVEAGPAVVMVAKEDMLKLLDRLIQANQTVKPPLVQETHDSEYAMKRFRNMEKKDKKKVRRKPKCVNAHDRCYGGAGGPCPYCEFTICDND
jgi:hypothetical protein